MSQALQAIAEQEATADGVFERVAGSGEPVVFRGLAANWPLVHEGRESVAGAMDYLLGFYNQSPVTAFVSEADIGGRLFYSDGLTDTNFQQIKTGMDRVLKEIREHANDDNPPTIYMGSSAVDLCLPGFGEHNSLPRDGVAASVRIWIGNRTVVAAHFDVLDNIACVCAGRRRFTLFPPEQLPNLYVGPMDLTPAGQQISLVDLNAPDLERYPRFAEALAHARTAELAPGDAIFIPSMWWHHVEGLERFNILINHWWRSMPDYMGPPGDVLLHAILNLRDLPEAQREAWRGMFDHYVFRSGPQTLEHIPEHARGVLGEMDDDTARRIRTLLRNKLNR